MIRYISLFIFTILTINLRASVLTEKADSAYTARQYDTAIELYNKAVETDGPSATLYYNLGNSHYRQKHNGLAIVCYESALRLDPTMKDARANLEFVNSRITDRPGERGTFIGNALDAMANRNTSNSWAWIAFGLFCLTIGGICLYIFSDTVILRKAGFFGALITLTCTLVSLFFAIRAANIAAADNICVVTAESTILSTSPRIPLDRNEEAMLLHEGTKLEILDSVKNPSDSTLWLDVQVDNSHRAWIDASKTQRVATPQ